jgi:Ca2+-dependent lipid-binding protein
MYVYILIEVHNLKQTQESLSWLNQLLIKWNTLHHPIELF